MKRTIIEINEEKCVGCGLCASACEQGAIQMIDGKAKLVSDTYCDGLGMCLPACPVDAIKLTEKEADAFDEDRKGFAKKDGGGCSGTQEKVMKPAANPFSAPKANPFAAPKANPFAAPKVNPFTSPAGNPFAPAEESEGCGCGCGDHDEPLKAPKVANFEGEVPSQLRQWPVQIDLVNTRASFFDGCNLLVAADCTAYAYGNFHEEFIKGRVTLIGCPKLDNVSGYVAKLTEIFKLHDISSVTVARMSVPCCNGITKAVQQAMKDSGKAIPYLERTISSEGEIL